MAYYGDGSTLTGITDTATREDVALLGFKVAANGSLARYNLVDQSIDAFEDASGVDASASTNEIREPTNYFRGATTTTPTVTGGTITTDGDYTVHSFTASGDFVTDAAWSGSQGLEYLVVAGGGGGGGRMGGGGGAGGYRSVTDQTVAADTYAVTVGGGGAGGSDTATGVYGTNSSIIGGSISFSASGGAGGNRESGPGSMTAGGSGGGSSYLHPTDAPDGGAWPFSQGNVGGYSPVEGYRGGAGGSSGGGQVGGGGGGASAQSVDVTDTSVAGVGADGLSNSITGSAVTYAGGGGAGCRSGGYTLGPGGAGGGGAGAGSTGGTGVAGTANTGGGGGGGGGAGGIGAAGGSGIVIIRRPTLHYVAADLTLVSNTLTAIDAVTKGDMVMTYTNGFGTATLNTDLKGWISRDNGSNYTELTLVAQGTTGGHSIVTAHNATLGGSDTSQMLWKVTTHNQVASSKETYIQAVSLGWS